MKYLFFSIILFFSLPVFIQTTIKGQIKDLKGEALPGANIYFQDTYDGTSSNLDGSFTLQTNLKGAQILKIEFLGFETITKELKLPLGTVQMDFILKEAFNKLKAVTITAGTFEAGDKKKSVVLSPIDMLTTAGAMGDIYGALKMLPGANANPESGRLFVKGGHSDESQTYINGTLVHNPYSKTVPNTSARGRFNPFIFGGTIFNTGGYSAEYGQALSSVLLLETKDLPLIDEFHFSLLSVGADAAVTKLWKDGGITATMKYQNLGPYMKLVPQNFDWIHYPESYGGELALQQKTKNGKIKIYANYAKSKVALNQPDPASLNTPKIFDVKDDDLFINASWKQVLSKKLFLNSGMSYTTNENDIHIAEDIVSEKLNGMHLKSVLNYHINPKIMLKSGIEYAYKNYDFGFKSDSIDFVSNYTDNQVSTFVEAEIYASNKFVARIGGRAEYADFLDDFHFSPRISTAYKVDEFSTLSLSWGQFHQRPSDDLLIYTNSIKSERSDHYTFGFQYIKNDRALRIDAYYKDYKNLVRYNDEQFYLPESYYNGGNGFAKGIDIFWRDKKSIRNIEYWISYSYLDTERLYRDYPTAAQPYYASKHNLSVVTKLWISSMRSLVGFTYRYASPRNYNDPNSNTFYSARTLAYQTINLNWSWLYRDNIIFYAAATNVFGFKQEFGQRFSENPDAQGLYKSAAIVPAANRFFIIGCFITLTKKGNVNQLDKIS